MKKNQIKKRIKPMVLLTHLVLGIVANLAMINLALAEPRARNERREARQEHRIREGVRSGELTRGEAKRLRAEQRHIDRAQDRMLEDGDLTAKEKLRLENMQDRASRHIKNQKHDKQERNDSNK